MGAMRRNNGLVLFDLFSSSVGPPTYIRARNFFLQHEYAERCRTHLPAYLELV
jgi:hypothetical protein